MAVLLSLVLHALKRDRSIDIDQNLISSYFSSFFFGLNLYAYIYTFPQDLQVLESSEIAAPQEGQVTWWPILAVVVK